MEINKLQENIEKLTQHIEPLKTVQKGDVEKIKSSIASALSKASEMNMGKIEKAVQSISDNIPKIFNEDVQIVLTSLMETAADLAHLAVGPAGMIFKVLCSFMCRVLADERTNSGGMIQHAVDKAFKQYKESELQAKIKGTYESYKTSHAFLMGVSQPGRVLTETEVTIITANVSMQTGVELLAEIHHYVVANSSSKTIAEIGKVLAFAELYCTLAIVRVMLLHHLLYVIEEANHTPGIVGGIEQVIASIRCQKTMDFLCHPSIEQAQVSSFYNTINYPAITAYLNYTQVPYVDFTAPSHALSPQKWPEWYLHIGTDRYVKGTKTYGKRYLQIKRSAKNPNFWLITNGERFIFYNINGIMDDRRLSAKPGDFEQMDEDSRAHWKFIKIKPEGSECSKFLISVADAPDRFLYMVNWSPSKCHVCTGNPGEQGYWDVTPAEQLDATRHFLLDLPGQFLRALSSE